jgi:hypothetical protein
MPRDFLVRVRLRKIFDIARADVPKPEPLGVECRSNLIGEPGIVER